MTGVLARATSVEDVRPSDARAGADYQRVTAGGRAYFLKRLSPATDWIMCITGDHVHRPYLIWQAGIMDKAPACIDHTVVAMEVTGAGLIVLDAGAGAGAARPGQQGGEPMPHWLRPDAPTGPRRPPGTRPLSD